MNTSTELLAPANIAANETVLCWCSSKKKVLRCKVVWHRTTGGRALPFGDCANFNFALYAEEEGTRWTRGPWTRENVYALYAAVAMGPRPERRLDA